jgi:exonuclease III
MASQVLFWNCCGGLHSKINSVHMIIDKYHPIAFFISEAEVSANNSNFFSKEGYALHPSNNLTRNGKSRLVCYILNGTDFTAKRELVTGDSEIIVIENNNLRIIGIYRPFKLPPNQTRQSSLDEFFENLTRLGNTPKEVCIAGDFNINPSRVSSETTRLTMWQDSLALDQLINTSTWSRIITLDGEQVMRKSMLDLVFVSGSRMTALVDDKWNSDHNLVVVNLPNRVHVRRQKTTIRSWKRYSQANIQALVRNEMSLITQEDKSNSDDLNAAIVNTIVKSFDRLCPDRVVRTSRPSDLASDEIERVKKKRKRTLAKYNKNKNPALLIKIQKLNKTISQRINAVRRSSIRAKMVSSNKNSFWSAVRKLQGESKSVEPVSLEFDDTFVNDPCEVAGIFGKFFSDKVRLLSNNCGPYQWVRKSNRRPTVSLPELEAAIKTLKSKMCSGIDGIPLKILKHSSPAILPELLTLMNLSMHSIPLMWKNSIVTPLHKSGSKKSTSNYRPISNLSSISKLFEKIVLEKLDVTYPNIEGQHQHGFRKKRSTITALLEIQHEIASRLDRNEHITTYSIDMSAAFDLLRPDVFHLKTSFTDGMMDVLMDFLTGRTFVVKIDGKLSTSFPLNVGCVQGSILGPKLFGIYCSELIDALPPSSRLVTYADDSYVINSSTSKDETLLLTKRCLKMHVQFLKNIGMVVNTSKTELMYSSRTPGEMRIVLDNFDIKSKPNMKALGVVFDAGLDWTSHLSYAIHKSNHLVKRVKFLTKYLTKEELLTLVTSQYFSVIYYASPLWIGSLNSRSWTRLNSSHYRIIRAALRDFKGRRKRTDLDVECRRATPVEWSKYIIASTVIKLYNFSDTNIARALRDAAYVNDRLPFRAKFIDRSRLKVGKQSIQNRVGPLFSKISFDWSNCQSLSDDLLRKLLKLEFFRF